MAKKQSSPLWEILDDIKWYKTGDLLNTEDYEKAFDSFMITKFLSMNDTICPYVAMVQEYQEVLSKKEYYSLLVKLVPKIKSYDGYIKSTSKFNDKDIELISNFNKCSYREARSYIRDFGSDYVDLVKNKYGGKIK